MPRTAGAIRCAPCQTQALVQLHRLMGCSLPIFRGEFSHTCCCVQPSHIAAQYGHTSALYHLVLRWNCDFNALDNENRTPLHWAAYKGFHDLVRLLLVLGCDPSAQDTEGCNCLHWAAIRGNSEAATILIQVGCT
jgi:hypothetical protein